MAVDKQKMEDNFNNIPIEELVDIVNNKSDDYDKEALNVAYKILKERQGVESKPTNNIIIEESTRQVHLTDIRMDFGDMVLFIFKWTLASIPTAVVMGFLYYWWISYSLK